jgi:alpha-glucosidase
LISTDHYLRFERVDSVAETSSGLIAQLHGEQLKIDIVSDDLVRIKISRGGVFDESPTFAVCVDPLASAASFTVDPLADRVLLITGSMTITLWLDPFRIDVHRADGSAVIETAQDQLGRYWRTRP